MKKKRRISFSTVYLALGLVIIYLPIALVILYSFNESKISSVWGGFSLKWYRTLFADKAMFQALGNSLILGLSASLAAGVVGTLGAVGFDRVRPRSRRLIEYLTSLPLMTPEIILGMVFMAFFGMLGIPFGMGTLILSHTTFCIPYVFMLVQARLVGMDRSLAEAARDLGAGERQVFFTITLPLLLPAIVSGMLLSFAMSLDDVIISLFVTGVNVNTLPIKVYTALKTGVTPEINALCTLLLAATLLLVGLSMLWSKISRLTGSGR
ncbi:MAG: ABC transporter permease [Oscillospiraceae bacterium]|nr:ABC transporter permease [Bacteroidales bacterium]MDD6999689.1 ABC transporter permease [Oscillospiraceae bacterium]MDY5095535.1 ABC transporter permease [Oscillospiraceae bacterium]